MSCREKNDGGWMPIRIGVYLADTAHLTTTQHGAYFLLAMHYWLNGGPLLDDDDALARIVKTNPPGWKKLRPVLAELFRVMHGVWSHPGIDSEMSRMDRNKQRANAIWTALPRSQRTALQAKRRAAKLRATPAWLTSKEKSQIDAIYAAAEERTKSTGIPHDVDHVTPLQGEDVCGLHVPWNLQVLTASANRAKGRTFKDEG